MIKYKFDLFGLQTLFIWHGSAVFRAVFPALLSTFILIIYSNTVVVPEFNDNDYRIVEHPYTYAIFTTFFAFLLAFRLNYSYQRYWEACTQVHQMSSKWLDSAICVASFHYQCDQYKNIRPPTFGQYPNVRNETRVRERCMYKNQTYKECESLILQMESTTSTTTTGGSRKDQKNEQIKTTKKKKKQKQKQKQNQLLLFHRLFINKFQKQTKKTKEEEEEKDNDNYSNTKQQQQEKLPTKSFKPNRKLTEQQKNHFVVPENTGLHYDDHYYGRSYDTTTTTPTIGTGGTAESSLRTTAWKTYFASSMNEESKEMIQKTIGIDILTTPSLFLQEVAHLYSLLSAVAMSTLRHDIEGTQSPLAEYIPGRPFPPVNPDELHPDIKYKYHEHSKFWTCIYFMLGIKRSPKRRTLYNAARPFRVIGGISDRECQLLQQAKGPYAQMALCNMWLKEFISREYLNGSTGKIAPPIIARIYQFISDGVVGYNQCRKVAFVPFPFPHAQITVFFSILILFVFPFLYYELVNQFIFACIMNFITVLCFIGAHEVARELENPYFTVPNDLPLNNFQAQFNEALISMYAGFHPDSFRLSSN